MNLMQLWADMNTWNKFGICAVAAAAIVVVLVVVF